MRTLPSEKGEAETSPRLGAGVVIILSDYLVLYSHYNHQHLVLTVGPKPEDRDVTNDRTHHQTDHYAHGPPRCYQRPDSLAHARA